MYKCILKLFVPEKNCTFLKFTVIAPFGPPSHSMIEQAKGNA